MQLVYDSWTKQTLINKFYTNRYLKLICLIIAVDSKTLNFTALVGKDAIIMLSLEKMP